MLNGVTMAMKIAWAYVVKYWKLLLVALGALVAFIGFLKFRPGHVDDRIDEINEIHEDQIQKITEAHGVERQQELAAQKKFDKTIESVQKQYDEQGKALDALKIKEISDLLHTHDGDEDELLKKLADASGFKVVLPS